MNKEVTMRVQAKWLEATGIEPGDVVKIAAGHTSDQCNFLTQYPAMSRSIGYVGIVTNVKQDRIEVGIKVGQNYEVYPFPFTSLDKSTPEAIMRQEGVLKKVEKAYSEVGQGHNFAKHNWAKWSSEEIGKPMNKTGGIVVMNPAEDDGGDPWAQFGDASTIPGSRR